MCHHCFASSPLSARHRQDALLGLLRARGETTIPALAAHFDVSVRTIHRDLNDLRARAVPIETDVGRGGGVRLNVSWSVPAVRFDLDELVGLVLSITLARQASNLPFGNAAQAALGKIMAALPADRGRRLQRLCRRVLVGPPASANVLSGLGQSPANVLPLIEETFSDLRAIAFNYVDRDKASTRRHVEPQGLLLQPPVWYLLAYDLERDAPRTFRLDRMSRARALTRRFTPRPLTIFEDTLRHFPTRRIV